MSDWNFRPCYNFSEFCANKHDWLKMHLYYRTLAENDVWRLNVKLSKRKCILNFCIGPPPVFTSRKKRRSPSGTSERTQPPKPSTPASKLCRIRRTPARKQKYAFLCTCRCSIRSEKIQIERNTWDSAASSVVGNLLFFRKNQHDIVENVRDEKRRLFSRDSECCAASCERLSRKWMQNDCGALRGSCAIRRPTSVQNQISNLSFLFETGAEN